ncbi:MAG: hypothetical protein KDI90_07045 [Alphaproteobacteria bacterium]|nr:hypothetical protein [Alphaproteobacteria bacterium]
MTIKARLSSLSKPAVCKKFLVLISCCVLVGCSEQELLWNLSENDVLEYQLLFTKVGYFPKDFDDLALENKVVDVGYLYEQQVASVTLKNAGDEGYKVRSDDVKLRLFKDEYEFLPKTESHKSGGKISQATLKFTMDAKGTVIPGSAIKKTRFSKDNFISAYLLRLPPKEIFQTGSEIVHYDSGVSFCATDGEVLSVAADLEYKLVKTFTSQKGDLLALFDYKLSELANAKILGDQFCDYEGQNLFNVTQGHLEAARGYLDNDRYDKGYPQITMIVSGNAASEEAKAFIASGGYMLPRSFPQQTPEEIIAETKEEKERILADPEYQAYLKERKEEKEDDTVPPVIDVFYVENATFRTELDEMIKNMNLPHPDDLQYPFPSYALNQHQIAEGSGTIIAYRAFYEGGAHTIDDEGYKKVTIFIPGLLKMEENERVFNSADFQAFYSSGASSRGGVSIGFVKNGTIKVLRNKDGKINISVDLVFYEIDPYEVVWEDVSDEKKPTVSFTYEGLAVKQTYDELDVWEGRPEEGNAYFMQGYRRHKD